MQNACMPVSITIRDVPDEVRDELAARAAGAGRSLQEHLRMTLIEIAHRPTAEALVAQMRARKATTGTTIGSAEILRHRDEDRR